MELYFNFMRITAYSGIIGTKFGLTR